MNFKEHLIGGVVVAGIITAILWYHEALEINHLLIGVPVCIIYSLIPDADHPNSKVRKWVEIIGLSIALFVMILSVCGDVNTYIAVVGLVCLVGLLFIRLVKHRTTFHSPLFGLVVSLPFFYIGYVYFIYAFCGFLTHLLLDRK